MVFDDIEDNSHFRELTKTLTAGQYRVFPFERKWVGLLQRSPGGTPARG